MSDKFDSNQIDALRFYYQQFQNWEKYNEIVAQRKQRADELRKLLTENKIEQLTVADIDKVYSLLWSAGRRFAQELTKQNKDISKIKKTFKYLLYGKDDVFLRFEKVSKDANYKLKTFSDSRISELFIKVNPESGISLVNERIIRLSNRLGLKVVFDKKSLSEKAKAYDEVTKTIQKQFNLKNLDETDMLVWFIDEYDLQGKQEPLPRFEKGQFLFVEEDFNSTTEKKEDSTFLHERFKLLLIALENKLPAKFLKKTYLNNHWSQSGRYLPYHWLGFVTKKVKNPRKEIQFQVDIHSDYFESTLWLDQIAKDKLKTAIEKIEQNKSRFLELIGKLPSDYELGSHGSSGTWVGEDFETGKFDQNQLDKLLELMKKPGAEFYMGSSSDPEGTIKQGLQITDNISQTFENLVPFYEFFSGTKIDEGDDEMDKSNDITFKDAAIQILEEAKEPLHYKEITKRAIQNKLITSEGKTPELSLLRDITEDIRINKEKSIFKKKSDGVYYVGELKRNYFVALGPWSNWEHSLSRKPILWGVKPDSSGTNIGEFDRLQIGDIVFFYVTLEKPSKFSKYGFFGVGKATRKCSNQKEPYWPDEIEAGKVIYTHRFQIEQIKIFENDDNILWFDKLPKTKGLAGITPNNPGLKPLLDAVKEKWDVNFDEIDEKYYLIQNKSEYPLLRKADIDKIFRINYASGISDYRQNNFIVLISSLAGVYRDKIGPELITYTGKGQTGDQTLTGGNLGIVNAKNHGRKLYFLEEIEDQNGRRTHDYRFLGEVEYLEHYFEEEPTENRKVIRFKLKRIHKAGNLRESQNFNAFDFVHENIEGLKNNSKLISFKKIDNDYYFNGYGHVGNFEQEQCTAPLRNLLLPITSKISPFCSEPILNPEEIQLKEKLEKTIVDATYGISGQKSIVLISILYWLSKTKFNESSLVEYLKSLNVQSDGTSITELELLVHNSRLFADYVLIYRLYQSLGLMKFEIVDRIGYHIKQSLEMNNNSNRLISDFSKNNLDALLSVIEPDRAKILLYNLLKEYLDESTLTDFWNGLYENYYTIKCPEEIQEEIRNQSDFEPESSTIQIKQGIYEKIMSQFSNVFERKTVVNGPLKIPDELDSGVKEIRKKLLIKPEIIKEIVIHLSSGRHVILAGPVGTGKTELSKLIPGIFWKDHCGYFSEVHTATADWNTQDVIGGITPKINPENKSLPIYEVDYGCVTKTILDNYDNSNNKFENEQYDRSTSIHNKDEIPKEYNGTWLVIDEFNRADIDKAFGQLFTALESMELKIPSDTKGKSFKVIPIPLDYRIIGTLNTADKHYLFSMSDALKRRFAFVEVSMPDRDEKDDEIYYALQNAFESMKNNEEFSEIVEIGIMPIINEKTEGFKQKLEIAYDVLDLCRAYKPLGTAILKSIYQTLLVAEKLKEKDAIDYALNANLIPQLETLDKTSLTLMYKFMFEDIVNYMQKDLEPENIEKYSKSFKAILEFIEFTPKSNNPNKKITLDDIVSDIRNDEMTNNVWNEIFNAVKEKRTKIGLIFEEDHLPFEMFQKSLFELTESESLL